MNMKVTILCALESLLAIILLNACGLSQADLDATITQAAAGQFASQTAGVSTATLIPTKTPTVTPSQTSTPKPTFGKGSTLVSAIDGMTMVYVPAGEFSMGSSEDESQADSNEFPQHSVYLDAYWIDQTEVTNSMFAAFVDSTGYETDAEKKGSSYSYLDGSFIEVSGLSWRNPQGGDSNLNDIEDHPVVHVSWNDAIAYCEWAGRRLPTEAEWEKAARGDDGLIYPWGDHFSCSKGNFDDETVLDDNVVSGVAGCDGYDRTAPVGSFPEGTSLYGALDMSGNVYEWVADWYDREYYSNSPDDNPLGPGSGKHRVLRGGSWHDESGYARSAFRELDIPTRASFDLGFRCAFSVTPLAPTPTPQPSPTPQHKIEAITIPTCVEDNNSDTQVFDDLLWVLVQNLYKLDSYRYHTLYRFSIGDGYADEDLSVDVVGTHNNLLDTPMEGFFYPLTSQTYERSHTILTDLANESQTETIVTEDGIWIRTEKSPGWMAFDTATSADMLNLADIFAPEWVLSFMIGGGGGTLAPGFRAEEPTMAKLETLADQEVMHRCWLLPVSEDDDINAYLIHYESVYTFLNNAELHLWTAEEDTQLVRLVLKGKHIGERLGEYEGVRHDIPTDFLLWMDLSDLDPQNGIKPPDIEEIAMTVTSDFGPMDTVAAHYNELPLPDKSEPAGESEGYNWISREYWYPVSTVIDNVFTNYFGLSWYQTPEDRLPAYVTNLNLTEATAFYLDEMSRRGWHLKEKFLLIGPPEVYLFFERDEVILLVILEQDGNGTTRISAILPPPDDVLDVVLTGWKKYTTQNSKLVSDEVTAIAFDALGRAWIGTEDGLNVFDGAEWINYTADDLGLDTEGSGFRVTALDVDQLGRVWVGTWDGLSVFDGKAWETYTPENSGLPADPSAITVDGAGRIWLATGYSSSVSVFDGNAFTNYEEADIGMSSDAIDVIAADQQDHIWIGTSGGEVYMFDGQSWEKAPGELYSIEDLKIDHQGLVWVATEEGLMVFDGEIWITYNTENSDLTSDWIRVLGIDQQNRVWLVTTAGRLFVLDTNDTWMDYTPINPEISLYFPEVLRVDPQSRIWVGTWMDGLSVFEP